MAESDVDIPDRSKYTVQGAGDLRRFKLTCFRDNGFQMSVQEIDNLIALARKQTGEFEIDFPYENGQNLKWDNCTKQQGHRGFVPFNQFAIDHLPDGYRDKDNYELIKTMGELVVSIRVRCASAARPKEIDGIKYPFNTTQTRNLPHVGTGRVWAAEKVDDKPCPCGECKVSPVSTWAKISILTAMHVVFDQFEVENSTFLLNYNQDDLNYEKLTGYKKYKAQLDKDMMFLYCVSHRTELVDVLQNHLKYFEEKCASVKTKYKKVKDVKLTAIVSHPHGYFKHVSIGMWEKQKVMPNKNTKYTYNTSTCPGSSGAPVFVFGKENGWWLTHHHSGGKAGLNYSGIGWM